MPTTTISKPKVQPYTLTKVGDSGTGATLECALPPGKYLVVDLCYVLPVEIYDEMMEFVFPETDISKSVVDMRLNGYPMIWLGTAHGDGTFIFNGGQFSNDKIGVDAGNVSVIAFEALRSVKHLLAPKKASVELFEGVSLGIPQVFPIDIIPGNEPVKKENGDIMAPGSKTASVMNINSPGHSLLYNNGNWEVLDDEGDTTGIGVNTKDDDDYDDEDSDEYDADD